LGDRPLEATIRVNHPLVYRGYAIYQSDFGDGGSKLELRAWPLSGAMLEPAGLKGEVGSALKLAGSGGPLHLELDDFRLFNLLPEPDAKPGDRKFRNFGPSVGFKLRDAAGEAREYFNYMAPVQLQDRWFFISGTRTRPGDAFTYLHIPADPDNSPERFLKFNARLRDGDGVRALLERSAPDAGNADFQRDFNLVRSNLVGLFVEGGFAAVSERAKAVVPAVVKTIANAKGAITDAKKTAAGVPKTAKVAPAPVKITRSTRIKSDNQIGSVTTFPSGFPETVPDPNIINYDQLDDDSYSSLIVNEVADARTISNHNEWVKEVGKQNTLPMDIMRDGFEISDYYHGRGSYMFSPARPKSFGLNPAQQEF
jgi:hypothetical protein